MRFDRTAAVILVAAALIALTGTGAVLTRRPPSVPSGPDVVAAPSEPRPSAAPSVPPGDPLGVRIPAIGVAARLAPLGVDAAGTLQVPPYHEAGWYVGGARPGEAGPAVIVAHYDSTAGPAVFYRLEEVEPGDVVHVDYASDTVPFVVRESGTFAKSRFPTERVYGTTDRAELRLVTCDGRFDRNTRSYTDNLVVWADSAGDA